MTSIQYRFDYQHLPAEGSKPNAEGAIIALSIDDDKGFAIIPNVGDHVHIANGLIGLEGYFSGIVSYRTFSYALTKDNAIRCCIDIVVQDDEISIGPGAGG